MAWRSGGSAGLAAVLLAASVWSSAAEPVVTEIVPVMQRAEQLQSVLEPLGGDDVSVQAYRGQLILRGPASRVAELKSLLGQLDHPLQNLRVSVRRVDASSQVSGGDRVAVGQDRVTVSSRRDTVRTSGTEIQQVTMLEGTPAWLSVDRELPMLRIAPSGVASVSTEPLGNGLEVVPFVVGDRVRLQVRQRSAKPAAGGIDTATVATELVVTPGTWVPLGDVVGNTGTTGDPGSSTALRLGAHGGVYERRQSDAPQATVRWEVMVEIPAR